MLWKDDKLLPGYKAPDKKQDRGISASVKKLRYLPLFFAQY